MCTSILLYLRLWCYRGHDPPRDHMEDASMWVKVTSVYDGDTITVMTIPTACASSTFLVCAPLRLFKVRLAGFDTPELKPRLNAPNRQMEIQKAQLAKKRIEELILHKCILLHVTGRDKYGRLLGSFNVGDRDIATLMIAEGHARPYDGGRKDTSTWNT